MTDEEIRALWFPSGGVTPLDGGELNFRSVAHLNATIKKNIHRIQGKFDLVVGIPRSGLTPGALTALYLNLPFASVDEFLSGAGLSQRYTMRGYAKLSAGKTPINVLVIDDSVNTGSAMRAVKQNISQRIDPEMIRIKYLAIYSASEKHDDVDYVFDVCKHPRIFEWNMMHHGLVESFIFDLDGILCPDGPVEVSNDGGAYQNYISSVSPKIIPSGRIGAVVTSRLDKHRKETEDWLHRNGISYSQLIMLNLPSAEKRRELAIYSRYKADAYMALGGRLFIESEEWQARDIFRITNKPVFCLDLGLYLS